MHYFLSIAFLLISFHLLFSMILKKESNKIKRALLRAVTILLRMKMGHTAVSDIKSSSVTLITLQKETQKNTVILQDSRRNLNQIETNILKLFRK